MSRSIKKHPFFKTGKSWKTWKRMVHKMNRASENDNLRHGREPEKFRTLKSIDYEFKKHYVSADDEVGTKELRK